MDYTPAAHVFTTNMRAFGQAVTILCEGATQGALEEAGRLMDQTVPIDTRALQKSRTRVHKRGKLRWSTEYPKDYAGVLEFGGYPGVGPRTMKAGPGDLGAGFTARAGVYSKQAPLGWVRKALAQSEAPWHARIYKAVQQGWAGRVSITSDEAPLGGNLGEIFDIDLG